MIRHPVVRFNRESFRTRDRARSILRDCCLHDKAQEVQIIRNLTSCLGSGSLRARDVAEFLTNLDNNPSLWAIIEQPKFDKAIDGLESVWQIIVRQLPGLNAPPDEQAKAWRLEQAAILIRRQWEKDIATRLARVEVRGIDSRINVDPG